MRIAALTSLLIAAAALHVSAAPVDDESTRQISYNDNKGSGAPADPWVELASATPASHAREFIMVGADMGTFSQLRITASEGSAGIQGVRVLFLGGVARRFEVNKLLGERERAAYVDLGGRQEIEQIVVESSPESTGSYVVAGNTGEVAAP